MKSLQVREKGLPEEAAQLYNTIKEAPITTTVDKDFLKDYDTESVDLLLRRGLVRWINGELELI
jgi:hypothetical protein